MFSSCDNFALVNIYFHIHKHYFLKQPMFIGTVGSRGVL